MTILNKILKRRSFQQVSDSVSSNSNAAVGAHNHPQDSHWGIHYPAQAHAAERVEFKCRRAHSQRYGEVGHSDRRNDYARYRSRDSGHGRDRDNADRSNERDNGNCREKDYEQDRPRDYGRDHHDRAAGRGEDVENASSSKRDSRCRSPGHDKSGERERGGRDGGAASDRSRKRDRDLDNDEDRQSKKPARDVETDDDKNHDEFRINSSHPRDTRPDRIEQYGAILKELKKKKDPFRVVCEPAVEDPDYVPTGAFLDERPDIGKLSLNDVSYRTGPLDEVACDLNRIAFMVRLVEDWAADPYANKPDGYLEEAQNLMNDYRKCRIDNNVELLKLKARRRAFYEKCYPPNSPNEQKAKLLQRELKAKYGDTTVNAVSICRSEGGEPPYFLVTLDEDIEVPPEKYGLKIIKGVRRYCCDPANAKYQALSPARSLERGRTPSPEDLTAVDCTDGGASEGSFM